MPAIDVLAQLKQHFADNSLHKLQTVQSLWSGYGDISRYISPRLNTTFIVKHISPPIEHAHPKGWNTQTSHQRKLQSYQVEANFYRDYASLCDDHCVVPKLLAAFSENQQQILVLQDLDQAGFSLRKDQTGMADVKLGIKWLAYFHARFLQQDNCDLWPVGTYWHLATRQDEFEVMQAGQLKDAAQTLDTALNHARFQTLVHGDAKLANFCFSDNNGANRLAAVDFQYVGKGVGVKDLAYFLGASLNQDDLFKHEQHLLDEYFLHLKNALYHYQINVDFMPLQQEWRMLYPLAWADFYRFLLGWSPGHYKINAYMHRQTDIALAILDNRLEAK
ncbi:oxidoreductase family protein [Paraglaciecola sp. MB-3u-78]|uniref:oxidoreductase family protein n=1 Tax=Paraglaciecola sp. MB-3u-78 TaxID=2058332 RepID=UPI000C334B8D|nr:oxidoreductase family protein [Paraglaciecola sp. MB-3u-78]PKG96106.1 choline kinase [Paraglaciecola sp. MB-3u-78]